MPPNNNPNLPNDPYAFMNNASTPSRAPSFINPQTVKGRVILIGSFAGILLICFVVIMSILGSSGEGKTKQYIELGQRQAELIRIASLGEASARDANLRYYIATVKLTMISSQSNVNKIITSRGVNAKQLSKQLTAGKNPATDQLLQEATTNNRFDETYKELLNSEIVKFQKQLNAVSDGASPSEKKLLQESFNNAYILTNTPKKES